MYVFLATKNDMDTLAARLREILSIPTTNRHPSYREQKRYGLNRGGDYYLFEVFGVALCLICNAGEVLLSEHSECPFYVYLEPQSGHDDAVLDALARHLEAVLRKAGLDVTYDPAVL